MTKILDASGKPVRCSARVWGSYFDSHCSRNAALRHDNGKAYCLQHDPVRKAEKRAEQDRQWKASWDAKAEAASNRRREFAKEVVTCTNEVQALDLYDRIMRRS